MWIEKCVASTLQWMIDKKSLGKQLGNNLLHLSNSYKSIEICHSHLPSHHKKWGSQHWFAFSSFPRPFPMGPGLCPLCQMKLKTSSTASTPATTSTPASTPASTLMLFNQVRDWRPCARKDRGTIREAQCGHHCLDKDVQDWAEVRQVSHKYQLLLWTTFHGI